MLNPIIEVINDQSVIEIICPDSGFNEVAGGQSLDIMIDNQVLTLTDVGQQGMAGAQGIQGAKGDQGDPGTGIDIDWKSTNW